MADEYTSGSDVPIIRLAPKSREIILSPIRPEAVHKLKEDKKKMEDESTDGVALLAQGLAFGSMYFKNRAVSWAAVFMALVSLATKKEASFQWVQFMSAIVLSASAITMGMVNPDNTTSVGASPSVGADPTPSASPVAGLD